MEQKLILSGIGGQGIVMMGQYLGYAAIKRGAKVTLAPSYGQEKRGSYVHCQLIIGDTLAAPSISAADAVFIMDDDSFRLYEPCVKAGGTLLMNANTVSLISQRTDIRIVKLPLSALALEAGNLKAANMVGLGALIRHSGTATLEAVQQVLQEHMKPQIVASNLKALELGYHFTE